MGGELSSSPPPPDNISCNIYCNAMNRMAEGGRGAELLPPTSQPQPPLYHPIHTIIIHITFHSLHNILLGGGGRSSAPRPLPILYHSIHTIIMYTLDYIM